MSGSGMGADILSDIQSGTDNIPELIGATTLMLDKTPYLTHQIVKFSAEIEV